MGRFSRVPLCPILNGWNAKRKATLMTIVCPRLISWISGLIPGMFERKVATVLTKKWLNFRILQLSLLPCILVFYLVLSYNSRIKAHFQVTDWQIQIDPLHHGVLAIVIASSVFHLRRRMQRKLRTSYSRYMSFVLFPYHFQHSLIISFIVFLDLLLLIMPYNFARIIVNYFQNNHAELKLHQAILSGSHF